MTAEREYVQRELPFVPIAPAREVLTAAEETAAAIARANGIARELLELQGTADGDAAFVSALHFLMKAAGDVDSDALLWEAVEAFGVADVVARVKAIGKRIARAANQDATEINDGRGAQFRARLP